MTIAFHFPAGTSSGKALIRHWMLAIWHVSLVFHSAIFPAATPLILPTRIWRRSRLTARFLRKWKLLLSHGSGISPIHRYLPSSRSPILIDTHPDSPNEFEKNFATAVTSLTEKTYGDYRCICARLARKSLGLSNGIAR